MFVQISKLFLKKQTKKNNNKWQYLHFTEIPNKLLQLLDSPVRFLLARRACWDWYASLICKPSHKVASSLMKTRTKRGRNVLSHVFATGSRQNFPEDSFPEESKYGHVDIRTRTHTVDTYCPCAGQPVLLILLSFWGRLVLTKISKHVHKYIYSVSDIYAWMLCLTV